MAAENMATENTERLNEMQQDTQLALANLVTTTASDRNAVCSLIKTIARLTTELASANSDIWRIRGDTFLPPPATTR